MKNLKKSLPYLFILIFILTVVFLFINNEKILAIKEINNNPTSNIKSSDSVKNIDNTTSTTDHISENSYSYVFTSNELTSELTSLGFGRSGSNGFYFNDIGVITSAINNNSCCIQGIHLGTITCWNGESSYYKNLDMFITINKFTPDFEVAIKEVFKKIFPNCYEEIFELITTTSELNGKVKIFDNREVTFIQYSTEVVSINISGIREQIKKDS